jgi:hypothetical protein
MDHSTGNGEGRPGGSRKGDQRHKKPGKLTSQHGGQITASGTGGGGHHCGYARQVTRSKHRDGPKGPSAGAQVLAREGRDVSCKRSKQNTDVETETQKRRSSLKH